MARKVGVSEATVSRVLNGRPGVSDATRNSVLAALDVLGYERPTRLRGDRTRLVGLVLPELQTPVHAAFTEVLAAGVARLGHTPVLCISSLGGVSEAAHVQTLLEQEVSGIFFVGGASGDAHVPHDFLVQLGNRGIPVVLVGAAAQELPFERVSIDDEAATRAAHAHLRSLGHERIGLVVGPPGHVASRRRKRVFADLGPAELVEHAMFTIEGGQLAASLLIERKATAVIFASDTLALGGLRAARRAGLDVPGDFSVVGSDDSFLMTCADPPLSTVRQPVEAMGAAALTLMAGQIEGGPASNRELLFEPELVIRASSGRLSR